MERLVIKNIHKNTCVIMRLDYVFFGLIINDHSMLFALPSYQFPYIVMNRCLYLRAKV
jgi:hypothetical protein